MGWWDYVRDSDDYSYQALCGCGEEDCWFTGTRYGWCRPCQEHHSGPECCVNSDGAALAPCDHPWDMVDNDPCYANYEGEDSGGGMGSRIPDAEVHGVAEHSSAHVGDTRSLL